MSTVEDTNKVDSIGIDKNSGVVILKIFDHLDWINEHDHLLLLQEKINSYLGFLESKEIYEAYPDSRDRKFQIDIAFLEKPSAKAIKFLDTVSKIVLDAGFSLTYSIDKL
jgi:hypothetical protein